MGKFNDYFESKTVATTAEQDLALIAGKNGDKLKKLYLQWQGGRTDAKRQAVRDFLMDYPTKTWADLASLAKFGILKGSYEVLKATIDPAELAEVVGAENALIAGLSGDEMKKLYIEWQNGNKDDQRQAVRNYLFAGNNPYVTWDELAFRALDLALDTLQAHVNAAASVSESESTFEAVLETVSSSKSKASI